MSGVFGRLAPYIQDFIYANHWEDLREIQKEACQVVWDTDDNLLLSSGTASPVYLRMLRLSCSSSTIVFSI